MHEIPSTNYQMAVRDFQRARKSAVLRQILARLRGQSPELLDYETIYQQLKPTKHIFNHGLEEIPLDKIVGSVGRYRDFTREFLPTQQVDETRWAGVKAAMMDMNGLPPIEVYQIGDAYFVLDGNHRVSVARKAGAQTISAYVIEVEMRVPLAADDDPNEVICKARYADFLARTNLDQHVPDVDMLMTVAGHYQTLLHQIEVYQERLTTGHEDGASRDDVTFEDAALLWYGSVYWPVIMILRDLGVMRRFSKQTETDIYVLLSERREELEQALGWQLELDEVLPRLVQNELQSETQQIALANPVGYLSNMLDSLRSAILAEADVGTWRLQQLAMRREGRLFSDLLVLFEGIDEDWDLLEAAIFVASADNDRILGLHIANDVSQLERTRVIRMVARFERRCKAAGLVGEFALEAGNAVERVLQRAAWSDLLFINLTHPPESTVLDRLRSFWGPVITRCPRPLLLVPHARYRGMDRMLLAYDGSPKADEALFVAAYNASRWGDLLTVLAIETQYTKSDALAKARAYLESCDVWDATYLIKQAPIGPAILETAQEYESTIIVMGGFGARPIMRLLGGSVVEYVLQHVTDQAVLICQ